MTDPSRIAALERELAEERAKNAGLTDYMLDDLRAHARGIAEGPDTYDPPPGGFTCFHCGETFRTLAGASMHFGTAGQRRRPACWRVDGEHPVRLFAKAALHGDDVHRAWLLDASERFILDGTVPPAVSGSNAESLAATARRDAFEEAAKVLLDAAERSLGNRNGRGSFVDTILTSNAAIFAEYAERIRSLATVPGGEGKTDATPPSS